MTAGKDRHFFLLTTKLRTRYSKCLMSEDTSRLVLVDSVRVDKATKHVAVTVSGLAERTLHRFTYPPEHPYRHLKPGWKLKMVHSGRGNPTLELVTAENEALSGGISRKCRTCANEIVRRWQRAHAR